MLTGRTQRIIIDTILLGIVGALGAQVFTLMLKWVEALLLSGLAGYTPPGLPDEGGVLKQVIGPYGMWLVPLATTVGGLISGVLVYSLAPEAEGHGTDTAVKAFHHTAGFVRARVAPLKSVASAITIGSGGAAGREGPIALIGAGIGSIYATLGKRSDEDRRLLLLIGMAAGLAAIFRSPIGTAIFAIEVLYSDMEFEAGALFFTMFGSIVAYVVNGLFVGWEPLFQVPEALMMPEFIDYWWYVLLGLGSGVIATLLPAVFYGLRDIFHKVPVPPHIKPAIGGLLVGILALALPQILGGGYGWIQEAMNGRLPMILLLALIFAKMLAFALTVSSGGSGGVFAPSLFVGAMVGGFMANLFHQPPAAFVIVGMGAVFGGAARVPIATLLMVIEMTGGFRLLVPAALAVILSFFVQTILSSRLRYKSLYEAQMPSRVESPAHDNENLCIALHLMCEPWVCEPNKVCHLDLMQLLKSGMAVSLSEEQQLIIGTLLPESSWVGKPVQWGEKSGNDVKIIAILRAGHMLLPHPDTLLQAEDRVLVIISSQTEDRLQQHLAPVSSQ